MPSAITTTTLLISSVYYVRLLVSFQRGLTPLHHAAMGGWAAAAGSQYSSQLRFRGREGCILLVEHNVANGQVIKFINYLLQDRDSPLHIAVRMGHSIIVGLLMADARIDLAVRDKVWKSSNTACTI